MSHSKPWTVGGVGATPSLDDVVSVARGHLIALDPAASERVKKESPPPKAFEPEPIDEAGIGAAPAATPPAAAAVATDATAAGGEEEQQQAEGPAPGLFLTHEQARAALITRLLSIMNGKSGVRLQLADFLKELLNRDLLPALPAADDHSVFTALADACKGLGAVEGAAAADVSGTQQPAADDAASAASAAGAGAPDNAADAADAAAADAAPKPKSGFAAAAEAAGLTPPGISAGERCVLTSGAAASAGVGALVIVAGRQLLTSVTAVAALSLEAAGAHAKSFEADVVEAQGYKGAIAAADELRGLLDGSKVAGSRAVGSKKGLTNPQQAAYTFLPQELGAAADALSHAYNAVRPEVQSAALVALCLWKCGSVGGANPILGPALIDAAHALLALASGSLARVAVLGAVCPAAAPQLQQMADAVAAGPLAAAQRQLADVGAQLLRPQALPAPGAGGSSSSACAVVHSPELRAALAASAALQVVQQAVAVEGLGAVVALRLQEGNAPAPVDPALLAAQQEVAAKAAAAASSSARREGPPGGPGASSRDPHSSSSSGGRDAARHSSGGGGGGGGHAHTNEYRDYEKYKQSREYKEYREYKEAKEKERRARESGGGGGGKEGGGGSSSSSSSSKKKDKKGGAAGLGLGKGTAVVRQHLEGAVAAAVAAAEAEAAAQAAAAKAAAAAAAAAASAEADGAAADGTPAAADVGTYDAAAAAAEGAAGEVPSTLLVTPEKQLAAAALVLGAPGLAAAEGVITSHETAAVKMIEDVRVVVEANQARRKPKVAKGARDFLPDQMAIREAAFAAITGVFKRHGAVAIDTPIFELRETLMGKYGEDSKLIYDLADQGGELLSLRYDLTVPFARYVAVNGIGNIKRYHIGKVYRRDQPQLNRGRFREFFQCDFDIAGTYASMVPDAEVLKVLVEILTSLQLGKFTIKLNHRKLLDAMLAIAGVPPQKFRPICSAIDKLDKEPWDVVRCEMVEEKGLPGDVADTIGQFVVLRGEPRKLLAELRAPTHPLSRHPDSAAALEELSSLFDFLEAFDALGPISFDLSLARGLDYYTGVIYEAVLEGGNVGSIAAGGRYDTLVGMFSGKDVPAVGVSIGIERVFTIMEAQIRARAADSGTPIRATETDVLVASIGNGMQVKRMALASKLWAAGIKAEFGFKPNPKMGDQLNYALEQGIPYMLLFGENELEQGVVKVKDMAAKSEETVALEVLVPELLKLLKRPELPAASEASS